MRIKNVYAVYDKISNFTVTEFVANNKADAIREFNIFHDAFLACYSVNDFCLIKLAEFGSVESDYDLESIDDDCFVEV